MLSPLLAALVAVVSSGWAGMPYLVTSGQEKGQGEEAPNASDQSDWPCQSVHVELESVWPRGAQSPDLEVKMGGCLPSDMLA